MSLANVQLGTSETTILLASQETNILDTLFCNTDTSTRVVTIYLYPSGGSAGDGTTIMKNLPIEAEDTFIISGDEKLFLDTGGKFSAKADLAGKVTVTVNYKV